MAKANLALLGGMRLQTDHGEPVPLSTKKVGALLAYLALHPGQVQARPKLASLLWGDRGEVPARDSLRQSLSLLRKALARIDPHALVAHEDTITFVPAALTTDAIVFGELVAREGAKNLELAVALYGGELLEGFQVRAPEFESWVTAERERFRELALQAMTRLLDHHLSMGALESGIRVAARLLAADPMQEQVHRSLMEFYYRQGRHGAALRQYRTCADVLAKELGIEPDAATKALRREILRKWNQQQGTIANGNGAVNSIADVEAEQPATPRPPERRQVTVLVSGLVGMSALAARIDPEELQSLIAAYRRCCMPIISRYGGTVGTLSGAEMLTYFGHPQAHEHDVERALHTGLGLVKAVSELDGGSAGALRLRVGIATGPVVIGDLIGDGANQPGIIGEAVQVAGWLQTLAEPDTVVIAESTRRLVGDLFDCNGLGQVVHNGFSQPISAWRVLGPSGIESRFEALRSVTTPLIGRDEELELLQRRWRQTATGEGRVVLLSGEAGIGKSRLAVELQERLPAASHTRERYFCSPHHQNTALYPFISQLQRAAGFLRHDDDRQRLDKVEAMLARATSDLRDAVPLIADLMSLATTDRHPPLELTPQKRKEKTLRTLLAQLEGLAAREPVLMVFEDVHWIDPTSLELLDMIVDRVAKLPVLLIVTFRPDFVPAWVGRPHVTLLTINRLPPLERAEMIARLTGGKSLPQEIADQIIDRTDGAPLFIEELTKAVLEGDLVGPAADRRAAGPQSQPAIPWTLHASLLARLDRLASVKEIAQIGAAVGREFSYGLIAEVATQPDRNLEAALAQLVDAGLVFQRGVPPDATYLFKHALVQDVAYASLSRDRRRELHACIARAIEARTPEVAISEPEVLAHHFTQAGCAPQAIGYWLKAGQLSLARSANSEAVKHIEQGLAIVRDLPEGNERYGHELNLQLALGNALNAARGHAADVTLAAYKRAHELIGLTGDLSNAQHVMEGLTSVYYNRAAYRECLQVRQQFLAIAEGRDDPGSLCVAHRGIASIHNVLGSFLTACTHGERAWYLYDQAKHGATAWRYGRDVGVSALYHLSIAEWHLGHLDRSKSHLEAGLALAAGSNHSNTVGYAHAWAAVLSFIAHDYDSLRRYAAVTVSLACEHGLPQWLSWAKCLEAPAIAASGDDEAAMQTAAAGFDLRTRLQAQMLSPVFLCALAQVHHCGGRHERALATIGKALRIADHTEERWMDAELWRLKGEVISAACDRNTADEVEQYFHRALDIARGQGSRMFELRAATSLSRYLLARRRPDFACRLLAPLYRSFTESFETSDLKQARAVLEEIGER